MAVYSDLINSALRNIGVIASGELPSAAEQSDALLALNGMLANWSAQALPIPYLTAVPVPMTGVEQYTLTQRPLKIESANVALPSGASKPVRIVPIEEYSAFVDRSLTGNFAEILYYDNAFPSAHVSLMPMPKTGGTLNLWTYLPLAQVASSDTVALPPGYERAIVWSLAMELAPQFGAPITPGLVQLANDAKTSILGLNAAVLGTPNTAALLGVPPQPPAPTRAVPAG